MKPPFTFASFICLILIASCVQEVNVFSEPTPIGLSEKRTTHCTTLIDVEESILSYQDSMNLDIFIKQMQEAEEMYKRIPIKNPLSVNEFLKVE